eukprot:755426-Hanusia_phi.AAC.1
MPCIPPGHHSSNLFDAQGVRHHHVKAALRHPKGMVGATRSCWKPVTHCQNELLCKECLHDSSTSGDTFENLSQLKIALEELQNSSRNTEALKAKQPPHFFTDCEPQPKCLTLLEAKIYCKRCKKEVDVFDIVPPQVFLSYNWGTTTRRRRVMQKIEDTTSLQCLLDVEGRASTLVRITCRG